MHKKKGCSDYDFGGMRDFRNVVNDYLLSDLGFIGDQMTWINGQEGRDPILERLDRVLHTTKWLGLFLFA